MIKWSFVDFQIEDAVFSSEQRDNLSLLVQNKWAGYKEGIENVLLQ